MYNWNVVCGDPSKMDTFRQVEMYRANFNNIVTHHVGMVSGAYTARFSGDGGTPQFVVSSRLVLAMNNLSTPNYYYFASRKTTPQHVIMKYYARGFSYKSFPKGIQGGIYTHFMRSDTWNGQEHEFRFPAMCAKGHFSVFALRAEARHGTLPNGNSASPLIAAMSADSPAAASESKTSAKGRAPQAFGTRAEAAAAKRAVREVQARMAQARMARAIDDDDNDDDIVNDDDSGDDDGVGKTGGRSHARAARDARVAEDARMAKEARFTEEARIASIHSARVAARHAALDAARDAALDAARDAISVTAQPKLRPAPEASDEEAEIDNNVDDFKQNAGWKPEETAASLNAAERRLWLNMIDDSGTADVTQPEAEHFLEEEDPHQAPKADTESD